MRSKQHKNIYNCITVIICLTGCSQQAKQVSQLSPATTAPVEKSIASTKPSTTAGTNSQLLSDLAQKLAEHKLDKLPNNLVICSINNVPITLADYRREFKEEQQEVQVSITTNPQLNYRLIAAAHKQGILLSKQEKENLLKSTSKMHIGGQKSFDKMLNDGHMTMKQFNNQVLDVGLACKTANILVERNVLNELVNHLLLSQAAKDNGFCKEAMNKYTEMSRSPEYKQLLATGAFSADDLRNEVITNELCTKQTEKIKSNSLLTDAELNDFYEKNRGKFRHGERVRLSQIFIASNDKTATTTNTPSKGEIAADSEKETAQQQKKNYQLAESLLKRAGQGEDFAALADQYSQDPSKRKKDGGDLGFQDETQLAKEFTDKIIKLAPGTVFPEVAISTHGYHIFKVTNKESPGFYRLEEVKGELKQLLVEQKGKQAVNDWLVTQRQKATLVITPELQNLLASNKLEKREDVATEKHRNFARQISGQGQHF